MRDEYKTVFILYLAFAACSPAPGEQVYLASGCPQCHGTDRTGTAKGPPLQDLRYMWTPETMTEYLENPTTYVEKDDRLKALKEQYQTVMPQFQMDEESRKQLAAFLLEQ